MENARQPSSQGGQVSFTRLSFSFEGLRAAAED